MKLSSAQSRAIGSARLAIGKRGPTILTGVGIAGFIATSVLAGRATLKAAPRYERFKKNVNRVLEDQNMSQQERHAELGSAVLAGGLVVLQPYALTIGVGVASASCIIAGHGIMLKRQAQLVAAYGVLNQAYKAYRGRVQEKLGEEEELKLYRSARTVTITDDQSQACEIIDATSHLPSPYARFFDPFNVNWTKTPEYNMMFLRAQQNMANDKLHAVGYLFLNEVYEGLGLERSQAGQMVGWKLDGDGDGFVDFGLYDIADENSRAFVNLEEPVVLLDFNVDGPIRI